MRYTIQTATFLNSLVDDHNQLVPKAREHFTNGAVVGLFSKTKVSDEVLRQIGSFLDRKDAAAVAETCRSARKIANRDRARFFDSKAKVESRDSEQLRKKDFSFLVL